MSSSESSEGKVGRREFLQKSALLATATAAVSSSALSYSRIAGSNDRISLGHIGIGNRGSELDRMVAQLSQSKNVQMTAVCDLWTVNRERAVAANQKAYGTAPRALLVPEKLLEIQELDAVIISTPEHSHSPLLKMAIDAGKDVYSEKPMGNVLSEVKAARDAAVKSRQIVQIGTQHRSEPYQLATREFIRTGALGDVTKYEIEWNYHGPRWRGRPEVQQIHEQDTNWPVWLMTKPSRPFDPQLYFEFRLYKEFSAGIADQWMSHGIDLCHFFMDETFPESVVANGGIFAWHDGRQNPDTFQALLTYPKGFMASYSTSFGNDAPSFTRIMGKKGTMFNTGGEGSPRWQFVNELGNHEDDFDVDKKRLTKDILLPGDKTLPPAGMGDEDLSHLTNWFECMRSRKQPNATVQHGFSHAVAIMMATQSYWSGKRLYWDRTTEQIVETAPGLA
ncbi:MAG TPA: Gfo/Idh/MocA family oxidoreductase [Candidatus Sulfotelmatobacter sp.]|nr:Gfo/Idh/MocA family oxidoreductase [Candidatus Sulfotelmatobacter sp.]